MYSRVLSFELRSHFDKDVIEIQAACIVLRKCDDHRGTASAGQREVPQAWSSGTAGLAGTGKSMKTISFPQLLHAFFHDWLVQQRNVSHHTVLSYRDSWRLFLHASLLILSSDMCTSLVTPKGATCPDNDQQNNMAKGAISVGNSR
jgi:hypothetical protein